MAFVYNSLIPELLVRDLARSKDFYVGLCGFKIEYERAEERFVFLSFQGSQIMLEELPDKTVSDKLGVGVNFSIGCDDVSALYEKIVQAQYPIYTALTTREFRVNDDFVYPKEFSVLDPDGYHLRFSD